MNGPLAIRVLRLRPGVAVPLDCLPRHESEELMGHQAWQKWNRLHRSGCGRCGRPAHPRRCLQRGPEPAPCRESLREAAASAGMSRSSPSAGSVKRSRGSAGFAWFGDELTGSRIASEQRAFVIGPGVQDVVRHVGVGRREPGREAAAHRVHEVVRRDRTAIGPQGARAQMEHEHRVALGHLPAIREPRRHFTRLRLVVGESLEERDDRSAFPAGRWPTAGPATPARRQSHTAGPGLRRCDRSEVPRVAGRGRAGSRECGAARNPERARMTLAVFRQSAFGIQHCGQPVT